MYALISLIIILTLSLLTVRIGTLALELTGMSRDVASFQAVSAFTGAGFTTQEAEEITAYPARRKIVQRLIQLGNAGIITSIAAVVLSFVNAPSNPHHLFIVAGLGVGLIAVSRSATFDRMVNPFLKQMLRRTATFELRDYTGLLQLYDNHQVADLEVHDDEWLANKRIADLDLTGKDGIIILGIRRPNGTYIAAPSGDDSIYGGDTVIAYGKEEHLLALAEHEDTPSVTRERRLQIQQQIDPELSD